MKEWTRKEKALYFIIFIIMIGIICMALFSGMEMLNEECTGIKVKCSLSWINEKLVEKGDEVHIDVRLVNVNKYRDATFLKLTQYVDGHPKKFVQETYLNASEQTLYGTTINTSWLSIGYHSFRLKVEYHFDPEVVLEASDEIWFGVKEKS